MLVARRSRGTVVLHMKTRRTDVPTAPNGNFEKTPTAYLTMLVSTLHECIRYNVRAKKFRSPVGVHYTRFVFCLGTFFRQVTPVRSSLMRQCIVDETVHFSTSTVWYATGQGDGNFDQKHAHFRAMSDACGKSSLMNQTL
jgi:hypothetical protein